MPRGKRLGRYTPSRRADEDDSTASRSGSWLTTYADAVTLLMAFFVLLYSMSEIDVRKFTAFVEGLAVPFGNQAGDGIMPDHSGLDPDADPIPPITELERPELPDRAADEALDAARSLALDHDQLDEVEQELVEALQEHGLEEYVERRREERGLVVSIASDDVLFELGSTRIDDIGREVIRVVSETLEGFPNPLLVEGHTDDVPLDRRGYTNWNLSTDRAVAVLSRMIEEHGLPPGQVGAVGYGEHHPYVSNATPDGRARNRRVDIVVLIEEVAS